MYFEDIYNKVAPLWKKEFSLNGIEETETYIDDIRKNYDKVDRIVDFTEKEKYTVWESMLTFTMYRTLTRFALSKWKEEKQQMIYLDEILMSHFEKHYEENLREEGNEEYLKQYKGFKNPPSDATNQ
ncbi:hypothetical protein J8281_18770 [Aquimarina sp. U1-2]|uniref:hypothetical protein n=1 Tax=Aquimarina sp. U1-2 TaxID=2823141 RepID=UPI001AECD72E|nr:hypothetical protein [Aquimarina sp. U1-2]MBP2834247.1 hypothetical protein [Aquimarina sp. U1-2]